MVVIAKQESVVGAGFEKEEVVVRLICGETLVLKTALLNKNGVTAWGKRQHTCEVCGVQYVAE